MKFIEIAEGLSVNIDSISQFSKLTDSETQIEVSGQMYVTNVPYELLKRVLTKPLKAEQPSALDQLARFNMFHTP